MEQVNRTAKVIIKLITGAHWLPFTEGLTKASYWPKLLIMVV